MSELTRTGLPEPEPDPHRDTIAAGPDGHCAADALTAPAGYELHEEIGRGGMGVVFRARDLDLVRDVAVKILLPRYSPNSATARRFVDEARITGRLQHPGIPAIYRVGTLADGRPFLAMKLINGRTLDELLKEQTHPTASGQLLTPFEQSAHEMFDRLDAILRRGRLLTVFEQIAQAVGFAHKEGVIHRDLKPSNVMVGAFGEVQVMDWGLAKSGDRKQETGISEGGKLPATVEYTPQSPLDSPHADATLAGSILGTPAYMPPEQAIGAIDQIGKPSDVFGLGAILCEILTGKPPFAAESSESSRQLAARAKLDDAFVRLDASGAEPELIALAKRCLAPEPAGRPRDAGEVATAVAALRAESEQRARQAEMDRARAEVKSTEERKRRRVKLVLVLSILAMWVVAGCSAWWIDSVRSQRAADQRADELRRETERKDRAAELLARQLTTERDVLAALNEVQVLREEGIKQADDPARWALTLIAAESAQKRAEKLLASGVPPDDLPPKVWNSKNDLLRDDRDRALLAELDRISEANDIRFLMPFAFSSGPSNRYAAAFRTYGSDLTTIPTADAVAWLKGHRFRNILTTAIRNWQQALPILDDAFLATSAMRESIDVSAAVAGQPGPVSVLTKLGIDDRLKAILDAVNDDPFAREWWAAQPQHDTAAMKRLLARPEIRQIPSRELSALADGMIHSFSGNEEIVAEFLQIAYERFPGEFWVNFRLGTQGMLKGRNATAEENSQAIRHLTAAVAARPRSVAARVALGMELLEQRKDDPMGTRMIRGAIEIDPTSPWPHLVLGWVAIDAKKWTDAHMAFAQAVRVDPDIAFQLLEGFLEITTAFRSGDDSTLPEPEIARMLDALIAAQPNHPGGHYLRASYRFKKGDYREALADYQTAKACAKPAYSQRFDIAEELTKLEKFARWETKLPAVLRGELRPATSAEWLELASYCGGFEKKFAAATRFAAEALTTEPDLYDQWETIRQCAAWAIQASAGKGTDASDLAAEERSRLRRKALTWFQQANSRLGKELIPVLGFQVLTDPSFASVREPAELAKLPPSERDDWNKLWAELRPKPRAQAPPPRPK